MGSSRASLWISFVLVAAVFAPSVGYAVSAAVTYESNLSKIDAGDLPPAATGAQDTALAESATATTLGASVAIVKLRNLASSTWADRGHDFVVQSLQDVATRTQGPIVQLVLQRGGIVLNQFWLTNSLVVRADAATLRDVAQNPFVERIHPNFAVSLPPESIGRAEPSQGPYEWNVERVRAPEAWALGITGSGVRVCITDTGVDVTHPDLAGRYFTTDPNDPYYPGGWMEFDGNGNPVVSQPHDTHGHGTHVSGTVAGDSADGTAIGVAPGAWLMMGLALPFGGGTFAQVIAGMQWCVSPYDRFGNPTPPANVQSMSWGGPGLYDGFLDPIKNSLLAGVIPVAATGNEGEGSVRSPGDIWGVFGIGATDINDNVADFSSGGIINWPSPPADWPFFPPYPSQYIKPDFSAPGVNIKSSLPGGQYGFWSGTSMATPHVSGTVALMIQASAFSITPEQAYTNLVNSVVDFGQPGQDTRYGWGRLDSYQAVLLSLVANTGVNGTVYDSVTGNPLQDVGVRAEELGSFTKTDVNGTFKLGLPEGTYNISFNKFAYFDQRIQVTVVLYNGTIEGYVNDTNGAPIDMANVHVVEANVNFTTDATGFYQGSVKAGTYNVEASATGFVPSSQSVDVPENDTAWANFTLFPNVPGMLQGSVSYSSNSTPISNALIWAEGPAKYQALTDASGAYSLVISAADAGSYQVGAFKGGQWPNTTSVSVSPGQTAIADFSLADSNPSNIAVYQDYQGGLAGLLSSVGYIPYAYDTPDAVALKWSISAFPVVVWSGFSDLNNNQYPTNATFLDILALADALGVSIVFGDSYNGWPYGINLLVTYTGDPAGRDFTWGKGDVYFNITADHPIWTGVGSLGDTVFVIHQLDPGDGDFTWFSGYTGTLLAQVGTASYGIAGDGVAVRDRTGGTRWVLLGSLAPQFWTNVQENWLTAGTRVMTNSVNFARNNSWMAGAGTGTLAAVRETPAPASPPTRSGGPLIRPLAYVELTVYLVKMPSGFVAGTVTDVNGVHVADVKVFAQGTPVANLTDIGGQYSIELPVGDWTIVAKKFGYRTGTSPVTVLEGQTTTLDFILIPQRRVGIMYDDSGTPLQKVLDYTDKFAVMQFQGNWDDLIAAVASLDLVILSGRPFESIFPTPGQFDALLAAADAYGVGILFLDSYFGEFTPYGVSLLVQYRGDPSSRGQNWCWGYLYQEITGRHAITRGFNVGDVPQLTDNTCFPFSWFSGFSGTTVGRLWTGSGAPQNQWGDNLAFKVTPAGSRWVLMGSYAPIFGYGASWTADMSQIFVNAAIWASTNPMQLTIAPAKGPVGTTVVYTGSGAPPNANLRAKFDDLVVDTATARADGTFADGFTVPEAVYGTHTVSVETLDENYAGEKLFSVEASLVLTPASGPPSSAISAKGHGFPANVLVDLRFAGIVAGSSVSGADGSFGTTIIVPAVRGGDYIVGALHFESGASAAAAFRVIEEVVLDVQASAGALHFRGEIVDFFVLVTERGSPVSASILATIWLPNGTSISVAATQSAVGIYKATYRLPGDAATGTYAVVATASISQTYRTGAGAGLTTFLVSPTLTSQVAMITSISGTVAQIQTDTGAILVDLAAVDAKITSIQGGLATISTSIGTLTANLAAIDAKITAIEGDLATVQTSLGTIQVKLDALDTKITSLEGDIARLKTDAGTTTQQLSSLQTTGGLVAMSSASVAAILSAIAAVFALLSWRATRKPTQP